MKIFYQLVKITTTQALENLISNFERFSKYFVFRGQADSAWILEPSLERKLKTLNIPLDEYKNYIEKYEEQITRIVSTKILREHKEPITPIEILAKIQHNKGATRLIDFTLEFNTALFFAFCDLPKQNAGVYAISKNNLPFIGETGGLDLFEMDFQRMQMENKLFHFYINEFQYSDHNSIQDFLNEKMRHYPKKMLRYKIGAIDIFSVKEQESFLEYQAKNKLEFQSPNENGYENSQDKFVKTYLREYFGAINTRMLRQKGLFLFSSNLNYTFEKNIFLGKTEKRMECYVDPLINPDYNEYYALKLNAIQSYRAIIKFEIDKSLTKYVLNTIRTRQNDFHFHFTFDDMYPDDFGFYQNLTHQLIEDKNFVLKCDPLKDKDLW